MDFIKLIIIKIIIIKKTIKTNLLKFHAPIKSPCNNRDIARVMPQAGQLHPTNMPLAGQCPLNNIGRINDLNMHLMGNLYK